MRVKGGVHILAVEDQLFTSLRHAAHSFLLHAGCLQELSLRLRIRSAAVLGRDNSFSVLDSLERPWSCCFPPLEMFALDYLQH